MASLPRVLPCLAIAVARCHNGDLPVVERCKSKRWRRTRIRLIVPTDHKSRIVDGSRLQPRCQCMCDGRWVACVSFLAKSISPRSFFSPPFPLAQRACFPRLSLTFMQHGKRDQAFTRLAEGCGKLKRGALRGMYFNSMYIRTLSLLHSLAR